MPSSSPRLPRVIARTAGILAVFLIISSPAFARRTAPYVPGYRYVSPVPGSQMVSPWNNVVLRQGGRIERFQDAGQLVVTGSVSGRHEGTLVVSDDGRTVVFTPREPYAPGETVSVRLQPGLRSAEGALPPLAFDFTVSRTDPHESARRGLEAMHEAMPELRALRDAAIESTPSRVPYALSNPADTLPRNFPTIVVNSSDSPEGGGIYITPFQPDFHLKRGQIVVVDNYGKPLFFRSVPKLTWDFKLQPNGRYTYYTEPPAYMVLDSSFALVDSFKCGNGYHADAHDVQVLPDGHALLMAYDWQLVDMSVIVEGGDPFCFVAGLVIQELDAAKNVVFQWRSWDYIPILDMVPCAGSLTDPQIDYMHGNSVELDLDGDILISSRHTSEITKIDHETGDVIWRWGLNAKQNDFTFINDTRGFSMQHDARRLPNGNITLFDNGNCLDPQYARALEYQLDEVNMTATLVWEYRGTPDIDGPFMGNTQRRDNGATMVCWGGTWPDPKLTDLHADGTVALELGFDALQTWTYRAFRFPFVNFAFSANQTFLNFGNANSGDIKRKTFDLKNTSPDTVIINGFGSTHRAYSITDAVPIVLRPNQKVTLHAEFNPISGGDTTGAIYVRAVTDTSLLAVAVGVRGVWLGDPLGVNDGPALRYALLPGQPNPFQRETTIRFDLPKSEPVSIEVFDVRGRRVETLVDGVRSAGRHSVAWRAQGQPNGIYFYRMEAGDFTATGRTVLIR